jgi:hypothetical protein
MEFTALFLAVTIVMLVAWRGPRALALALFAATPSAPARTIRSNMNCSSAYAD